MILTLPCLICYRRSNTHVVERYPEWNATRGGSKPQMKSDRNEKNVKVRMDDRETR
jgi:hypothetical protein